MKDLVVSIWNIFRHTGRILTFIRNGVLNLLFLILVVIVVLSFIGSEERSPELDYAILHLALAGDIVEERRPGAEFNTYLEESLGFEPEPEVIVLQDIVDVVRAAGNDPKIKAILLDQSNLGGAGLDQLQLIAKVLDEVRAKGKTLIAVGDFYTQKQYFLASHADTVILNPMGGVELHGFGLYRLYFREALESLKVNYHIFRVGEYKSAIEPLTRSSMSPEDREQSRTWLEALWTEYTGEVVRARALGPDSLDGYIANIQVNLRRTSGDAALLAEKIGLVDHLYTRQQLKAYLQNVAGVDEDDDLPLIDFRSYLGTIEATYDQPLRDGAVAVVIAEGNILGGRQPAGVIGSESLGDRIREVRENDELKALVLRINSGGGSAFASEVIRQELLELKKAGKPFVVSMGSMAASGGYWIAADADQIWASPATLTGSIGIFGAIPTFENTLAELGVYSDGVGTSDLSAGLNLTKPLPQSLKESIQLTVNHGYQRFLDIVANGRNIPESDLSAIAGGRVFAGEQAQDLGLVDRLGNLEDAVAAAAELAGVSDHSWYYVKPPQGLRERLLQQLASEAAAWLPRLESSPPRFMSALNYLESRLADYSFLTDPKGVYAHAMVKNPMH